MSDMVEIQVTKGLIRQVNEKCLQKTEYTIKAKLNSTEEIHKKYTSQKSKSKQS